MDLNLVKSGNLERTFVVGLTHLAFAGFVFVCWGALLPTVSGASPCRGLNLPPTQGTTNAGAFQSGVYRFDYSPEFLRKISVSGFTHIRVPVNIATAKDSRAMQKIAALFASVEDRGILCMFDTNQDGETGHGDGKPNDLIALASAWRQLHRLFRRKPNVAYEIFNEPFGYAKTTDGRDQYLTDMKTIIRRARLPSRRCIIDGMGYADDIQSVAKAGWRGALGYHFYPNWLPEQDASREAFSKLILQQCSGIANKVVITEFGTRLDFNEADQTPSGVPGKLVHHRSALAGLRDALLSLKASDHPISGTYHWHGWDNGDSYSYWDTKNRLGALMIRKIQDDCDPSR
jgi:hypothetical protein